MPELPEVETTVRGLARHLDGARIERVALDPLAVEVTRQPAHGGFDFGKLGHCGSVAAHSAIAKHACSL